MMFENHLNLNAVAALLLGIIPFAAAYDSTYTRTKSTNKNPSVLSSIVLIIILIVIIVLIYKCCHKKKSSVYIYEEPIPVNNSDNINNGNNNTIVNFNFNGDTVANGGVINKGQVNGDIYAGGTNITGSNSGNNNPNTSVVVPQTSMANASTVYTQPPVYSPGVQYVQPVQPAQYVQPVVAPVAAPVAQPYVPVTTPYYQYYPQPGVAQPAVPVATGAPVAPVAPTAPTAPADEGYQ